MGETIMLYHESQQRMNKSNNNNKYYTFVCCVCVCREYPINAANKSAVSAIRTHILGDCIFIMTDINFFSLA